MTRQRLRLKRLKKIRSFNFCKLLFAALPTIVFGIFTIIFTLQQNSSAKATREQDQRQEDETNRRTIFKEYIDDMTDLLLNRADNITINKTLRHIRVQTLTVLQNLDANRKRDVIVFLYENQLLRSDVLPHVDLHGANLNGLRFWSSSSVACLLPYLYLPGTYAENIIFDHCSLGGAVFDNASMPYAKFIGCTLLTARFVNTNLTRAQFQGNNIYKVDFSGSYLTQSSITGGTFRQVNLTNADLYQSDISNELLNPMALGILGFNTFLNTRFSNGSFSDINRQNFILNDEPVFQCPSTNASDCFFITKKNMTVVKVIDIRQLSLLIDLEQVAFNLSVFVRFNIPNNNDEFLMTAQFIQHDNVVEEDDSLSITKKNNQLLQFEVLKNPIPAETRFLLVMLLCDITIGIDQFCIFDDVKLFIFERKFLNLTVNYSTSHIY